VGKLSVIVLHISSILFSFFAWSSISIERSCLTLLDYPVTSLSSHFFLLFSFRVFYWDILNSEILSSLFPVS
jgi:hypothetical protein